MEQEKFATHSLFFAEVIIVKYRSAIMPYEKS